MITIVILLGFILTTLVHLKAYYHVKAISLLKKIGGAKRFGIFQMIIYYLPFPFINTTVFEPNKDVKRLAKIGNQILLGAYFVGAMLAFSMYILSMK